MRLLIPSIYWPIAKLGFSRAAGTRRVFRRVFSNFYRKRIWNALINSWARQEGLDRREYARQNNIHAFGSVLLLSLTAYWLYYSEYQQAACFAVADLLINMPAIVLSRYLYLITVRRLDVSLHPDERTPGRLSRR